MVICRTSRTGVTIIKLFLYNVIVGESVKLIFFEKKFEKILVVREKAVPLHRN